MSVVTGIQLQKAQIGHLQLDIHVKAHRLRDKYARGEPITIENFVVDKITPWIALHYYISSSIGFVLGILARLLSLATTQTLAWLDWPDMLNKLT